MAVQKVTDATFSAVVIKNKFPVVVKFSATWSGESTELDPIMEELSEEKRDVANSVLFVFADVDTNTATVNTYNIRSVPTIAIFKNGAIGKTRTDVPTKNIFTKWVNSNS